VKQVIRSNLPFIIILVIALVVWGFIFSVAAADFYSGGTQPHRAVWNGSGHFEMFGYTVYYSFEGYLDYDYYYNSWGQQFVNGFTPYTDAFNRIQFGDTFYNTPFFLPPLYVYMCALGVSLPLGDIGIGFLITLFGFLTAFPIYGISNFLSRNRNVGALAVATYLFNPVVLFHTVFEWLNPAPFVFFGMLSFYLLMRGNRISGTLAMVTSALFKQTAFFLALPLVAYLLRKPPVPNAKATEEGLRPPGDDLDLRGFAKMTVYVLLFAGAISLPYIFDIGNYLYYIFQRPGGMLYTDVTTFPNHSQPISFAVLFITLNQMIQTLNASYGLTLPEIPESIVQLVNLGSYYTVFLVLTMIPLLLFMLLNKKDDTKLREYWSRMMFLTLLLMLCLHLFSPRGIYKYYTVLLIPFFSILPVSRLISPRSEKTKLSTFMIFNPLLFGVLILFPSRYVYLAYLLLIMVGYIAHKQFSLVVGLVTTGLRRVATRIRKSTPAIDSPADELGNEAPVSNS
jgi:hypothetical protein